MYTIYTSFSFAFLVLLQPRFKFYQIYQLVISKSSGIKFLHCHFLQGDNQLMATLSGPGVVFIQSLPFPRLSQRIARFALWLCPLYYIINCIISHVKFWHTAGLCDSQSSCCSQLEGQPEVLYAGCTVILSCLCYDCIVTNFDGCVAAITYSVWYAISGFSNILDDNSRIICFRCFYVRNSGKIYRWFPV